jgi:hypothetical protein
LNSQKIKEKNELLKAKRFFNLTKVSLKRASEMAGACVVLKVMMFLMVHFTKTRCTAEASTGTANQKTASFM